MNQKHLEITARIFNFVYSIAKRNRPFSDIEDEIDLQTKNGMNMGVSLHSRDSAAKIVHHIATQIKKQLFNKIIKLFSRLKVCVIFDEASTVSSKCALVVFLKVEGHDTSPFIFVDLVELDGQDGETITKALLKCFN